jgi:S-adenosylmethionine hydrolase
VVDPGVGTERRAVAVRTGPEDGEHYFVGPDNGLLIPAARSMGKIEVYEITHRSILRKDPSSTFHGRDVFAPAGAHLSKGMDISSIGDKILDFKNLDFGKGVKKDGSLQGKIIFIDSFGNLVTNIPSDLVDFQPGDTVKFDEKQVPYHPSYGFCRIGEPLLLIGSHGYLEIAVNQGSAALFFGKDLGDEIAIRKDT